MSSTWLAISGRPWLGDVVLKRPKLTVEGAAELQEVEAWMNDRVSRDARGACAEFLGSYRISSDEAYLSQADGVSAKEGLWLVWRFEAEAYTRPLLSST